MSFAREHFARSTARAQQVAGTGSEPARAVVAHNRSTTRAARSNAAWKFDANSAGAEALEFCVDTRAPGGCIAGIALPVVP